MGVPNFYSWLIRRYPMALYECDQSNKHNTDFLYMDMNQIIYKCVTNPTVLFKDQVKQRCFDEIWVSIFNFLDNIVSLVNPQMVLFLTFDGVAPRAKMNQQRQRRFQSAKRYAKLSKQLQNIGAIAQNETFKNNQISPGTEFMHDLNIQLKFYIQRKFHEDSRWNKLKVIFSGSDVPGEGEHKILAYIRNLKKDPNFNPNWTHMIYGADADLIMLGLITKLKYITIVRENMKFKQEVSAAAQRVITPPQYQIINLSIIREYMDLEYSTIKEEMIIPYDIHRVLDDFVMLCFFIGNDFLPRIFCFDIILGTLEALVDLFKQHLCQAQAYIIDDGEIHFEEFARLLKRLLGFEMLAMDNREKEMKQYLNQIHKVEIEPQMYKELSLIEKMSKFYQEGQEDQEEVSKGVRARSLYYHDKCGFDINKQEDIQKLGDMSCNYIEGVQFVLYYYFKGIPSWSWYYKYYYAPLCGDIYLNIMHILQQIPKGTKFINFPQDFPYSPFKQLLSILSPDNASLLPEEYGCLLTSKDSKLRNPIDYYPSDFEIDPYGAIWEHQHIAKIPFLNEELINSVYESIQSQNVRNITGTTIVFQSSNNQMNCKSTLPDIFSDFIGKLESQHIDIEDYEQCVKMLNAPQIQIEDQQLQILPIPSLKVLKITKSNLIELQDNERKAKLLTVNLDSNVGDFDAFMNELMIRKFKAYCNYPIQSACTIIAVMNETDLIINPDFKMDQIKQLDKYSRKFHKKGFKEIQDQVYSTIDPYGVNLNLKACIIARVYRFTIKDNTGKRFGSWKEFNDLILPIQYVFLNAPVNLHYPIDQNLEIGGNVIVFDQSHLNGSLGVVESINEADSQAQVKILRQAPKIKYVYKNDSCYYSLSYVADKLDCSNEVVLYVLGNVVVILDANKESQANLAERIDIGLKIINRAQNQLVPELVRLPFADQQAEGYEKYKNFKRLELNQECVDLLVQYKKHCPNLFSFLNKKPKEALKNVRINSLDLYQQSFDSNIDIFKVYIWILQIPSSQYLLQSSAAKVAKLAIDSSQQYTVNVNQSIVVDQYLLFQQCRDFIPPYFKEHPYDYVIGDRVVSLVQPFGLYGIVVGIVDAGEVLIQVHWDQPYIGFSNLGGRYGVLECSVCKFTEIFNISKQRNWATSLASKAYQGQGWDYQTKLYRPEFKSKAINSDKAMKEIHQVIGKSDPFANLPKEEIPVPKVMKRENQQILSTEELLDHISKSVPQFVTDQTIQGMEEGQIDSANNQIKPPQQKVKILQKNKEVSQPQLQPLQQFDDDVSEATLGQILLGQFMQEQPHLVTDKEIEGIQSEQLEQQSINQVKKTVKVLQRNKQD